MPADYPKESWTSFYSISRQPWDKAARKRALVLQALWGAIGDPSPEKCDSLLRPFMNLIDLPVHYESFSDPPQLDVLLAVCQATYGDVRSDQIERYRWSTLTFGDCLKSCYLREVFRGEDCYIHELCISILDVIDRCNIGFSSRKHDRDEMVQKLSPGELINTPLSKVLCMPYHDKASAPVNISGRFERFDLNIAALTTIGKLEIEWTSMLDDHMILKLGKSKGGGDILTLYWPAATLEHLPIYE